MIVTVDILRAAGLTDAQVLRVIELAEQAAGPSAGAQRTRRWRERHKASQASHVTSQSVTASQTSQIALSSSSLSREENDQKERKKERKNGETLPADWRPNSQHYREAAELGRSRAWVDEQAKDMRLWATANANRAVARKLNWDATFLGWVRRNAKQSRGQAGRRDGYAVALEELKNGNGSHVASGTDAGSARTIDHEPDFLGPLGEPPERN